MSDFSKEIHEVQKDKTFFRNKVFDIAKAIGIIAVVLAHANFPYSRFVGLFHVALFFIISGSFFKEKCYTDFNNIFNYLKRKVRTLAIPYIIVNVCFFLLNNYLSNFDFAIINNEISNIKTESDFAGFWRNILKIIVYTLALSRVDELANPTWFLKILFLLSIGFCIGSFVLKKVLKSFGIEKHFEIFRFLVCLLCLSLGYFCQLHDFNYSQIGSMLSCVIAFELGIIFGMKMPKINISFLTALFAFVVLFARLKLFQGGMNLVSNHYGNPFDFVICSVFGFVLVLYLSEKINQNNFLARIFVYIGQNTLSILCLHLTFFKLVVILQVNLLHLPKYMYASFPVYSSSHSWWLMYTIAGVAGPLLLQFVYQKAKKMCTEKLNKISQ